MLCLTRTPCRCRHRRRRRHLLISRNIHVLWQPIRETASVTTVPQANFYSQRALQSSLQRRLPGCLPGCLPACLPACPPGCLRPRRVAPQFIPRLVFYFFQHGGLLAFCRLYVAGQLQSGHAPSHSKNTTVIASRYGFILKRFFTYKSGRPSRSSVPVR